MAALLDEHRIESTPGGELDWGQLSRDEMKPAHAIAAVVLAALLLAGAVQAQITSPTGNLYGSALDSLGAPLFGVTVTITGPGAAQTAITDVKGGFHFLNLSPGAYSLRLERTGFGTARQDVSVALGNVVLSVILPVAGVAEEVTVEGDAPGMDSRKIETGATYGAKELESIPTTRDPVGHPAAGPRCAVRQCQCWRCPAPAARLRRQGLASGSKQLPARRRRDQLGRHLAPLLRFRLAVQHRGRRPAAPTPRWRHLASPSAS